VKFFVGTLIVAATLWVAFVVTLLVVRPKGVRLADVVRIVPDVVRLLARLAKDPSLPLTVRLRVWLLIAYLAAPIDLVPDFIPVVGYADDVILVYVVLRRVVRAAGDEVVTRHWPGSPESLTTLNSLLRVGGPA
jgi:uncharacterized membrane protein YkvA (DUF1232 family)